MSKPARDVAPARPTRAGGGVVVRDPWRCKHCDTHHPIQPIARECEVRCAAAYGIREEPRG